MCSIFYSDPAFDHRPLPVLPYFTSCKLFLFYTFLFFNSTTMPKNWGSAIQYWTTSQWGTATIDHAGQAKLATVVDYSCYERIFCFRHNYDYELILISLTVKSTLAFNSRQIAIRVSLPDVVCSIAAVCLYPLFFAKFRKNLRVQIRNDGTMGLHEE